MKIISLDYRVYFIYGFMYIVYVTHTYMYIYMYMYFLVQQILKFLKSLTTEEETCLPFYFQNITK